MAASLEALHTISLPQLSKDRAAISVKELSTPKDIAQDWLSEFSARLASGDVNSVIGLIHEDGWWRDHLALSWDFRTLRGLKNISEFLSPILSQVGLQDLKIQESGQFAPSKKTPIDGLDWIEFMFSFKTAVGSGKGMARLVSVPNDTWKAHMLHTSLQELDGHPEKIGDLRPHGGNNSLKGGAIEGNWYERRQRAIEFLDEEPTVLIIGAGQSGLNLGARLQALGLSCLIIDRNDRIGDNWRLRYRTLVTHDPVQYTHMAYMPFPSNWPLFTPKDKLADWFEIYASAMELNVWMKSTVASADFSDEKQSWTVEISRKGSPARTVKPQHIVLCTGHSGEPKIPSFPGQNTFKGRVYHGSQHKDATFGDNVAGKKVVVVGTGNSGHDIAQNYYENGAEVSMLQRSGTYVISARTGLFMLHKGLYDEHGPPTEDADVFGQSLPIPVQFALNVGLTERIKAAELANIDGLEKVGFKIDFGNDGSGIFRKYITRGGGYYIDVGATQLIIDGKIKVVQSPDGIKGFTENSLVLADGRELEADVVVLATGYDNMRTSLRKSLGDKIADRCKDVWDLDEEGEVNAMWRPSGHPKLWFMGGNLALCRSYSKLLALQIKATEEGLVKK
ncbi:putative flavin-containing monooxygenase YUCCA3 [Rhizodiscina lignyota]|uniref:Flavin-containing monooxygenase YUCCA3 n=1 Tax=Rhizodiscina lignyota TaxID=1504668 RepID=A0A9P4I6M6_9PEZI|nr:putative flavin-containing monooxygenase YUCCA3 [Rhizodiscina lignyota]